MRGVLRAAAGAVGLAMLAGGPSLAAPASLPEEGLAVLEPSGALAPLRDLDCGGALFCTVAEGAAAPPEPAPAAATPIPLPAALTLLGAGLAVLGMLMRGAGRPRG
jgi:hypothetical protein